MVAVAKSTAESGAKDPVKDTVKRSSGKLHAEMFDDVPVLQRKWQAALRPGERLPRYEDVMLGSLGRLADHIALIKENNQTLEISRTGPRSRGLLPRITR